VNHSCKCGPFLNPRRVAQLPLQYGPGSMNRVLREAVQACIEVAYQEQVVYNLLRPGDGKVIITANIDSRMHAMRLPPVDKVSSFWNYLESLFEELACCENFFTSQPLEGSCIKCNKQSHPGKRSVRVMSEDQRETESSSMQDIMSTKRRWSSESSNSSSSQIVPSKVTRKNLSTELEAASSTTTTLVENDRSTVDPSDWTIEDVAKHISTCDPALSVHTDLFRKHEIDGKALLLLNSDMMMKYMGLKLGPALKICNLIEKVKNRRH